MHSYRCPSQCSGERSRQNSWRCFAALCECHLLTQPNSWVWQASALESPECSWVHGWAALPCTHPLCWGSFSGEGCVPKLRVWNDFLPCHSLTHPYLSSSPTDWGPRMLPHQWVSWSVWVILAWGLQVPLQWDWRPAGSCWLWCVPLHPAQKLVSQSVWREFRP